MQDTIRGGPSPLRDAPLVCSDTPVCVTASATRYVSTPFESSTKPASTIEPTKLPALRSAVAESPVSPNTVSRLVVAELCTRPGSAITNTLSPEEVFRPRADRDGLTVIEINSRVERRLRWTAGSKSEREEW